MKSANRTMGASEWLLLLFLSMLWGGSFFFIGVAVRALPPLTIVTLRVALAAAVLHLVVWITGSRLPRGGRVWLTFVGMGLLNNALPFCLIVWGQTHIAGGLASILNATTPLFTVVVAHFLTEDERLNRGRALGVLVGLGGVVVIIGPEALGGLGDNVLAQLAVLGAALSYAVGGVLFRQFRSWGLVPITAAAGQVTSAALVLLPMALVVDRPWMLPLPPLAVCGALVCLAVVSTALAYLIYFRLLASAGATNVLLVTFLIPVCAIVLGAAFLGEQLLIKHFVGMALIAFGLLAIDGRPLTRLGRVIAPGRHGEIDAATSEASP